jgi:hypothetical protein
MSTMRVDRVAEQLGHGRGIDAALLEPARIRTAQVVRADRLDASTVET